MSDLPVFPTDPVDPMVINALVKMDSCKRLFTIFQQQKAHLFVQE